MRRTLRVVFASFAALAFAIACSDDDTASSSDDGGDDDTCFPSVATIPCDCDEGEGIQELDTCTDEPIGDCQCPYTESCTASLGCTSTRTCNARGICPTCSCFREQAGGRGVPRELELAPDGTPYVLLDAAPWLVRVDASTVVSVDLQSDLSWAEEFLFDDDGTIVVAGWGTEDGTSFVQIQRFEPSGALLGATRWSIDAPDALTDSTALVGVEKRPDGSIVAIASRWDTLATGTVSASTTIENVVLVDLPDVPGTNSLGSSAADTATGPNGELFISTNALNDTMLVSLGADGQLIRAMVDTTLDGVERPRTEVDVGTQGEVYWGVSLDHISVWSPILRRTDPSLETVWELDLRDDERDVMINHLVALSDSILHCDRNAIRRVPKSGAPSAMLDITGGEVIDAELAGPWDLVVLTSRPDATNGDEFRVERIVLDPLNTMLGGAGDSCGSGAECESDRCCFEGSTAAGGTCSGDATCPARARCETDADCTDGLCWLPTSDATGVCSQTCDASSECPTGSYCAAATCAGIPCPNVCLVDCLSGGAELCTNVSSSLTCETQANVEGVDVSLCVGPD